jgi:pyrimidine-nucleoside phosphorylase
VKWIAAQGGPSTLEEILASLPTAPVCLELRSDQEGWIESIDAEEVGKTVVDLGGGRHDKDQSIDTSVGAVFSVGVSRRLKIGDRILEVHAKTTEDAQLALQRLKIAVTVSPTEVKPGQLILGKQG